MIHDTIVISEFVTHMASEAAKTAAAKAGAARAYRGTRDPELRREFRAVLASVLGVGIHDRKTLAIARRWAWQIFVDRLAELAAAEAQTTIRN